MKKILLFCWSWLAFIGLAFVATPAWAQTASTAVVQGKIEGKQLFSTVSVSAFSTSGGFEFVTTRSVGMDGSFRLEMNVPTKNYFQLNFTDGKRLDRQIFLVLSPGDQIQLTLQSELAHLSIQQVRGSEEISFIAQYQSRTVALMDRMQGFEQDFALAQTNAEKMKIQHTFNQLYSQHLAASEALLKENAHLLAAAFLAYSEFGTQVSDHKALFQSLYNSLHPAYPQDMILAAIKEGLENPIAVGNIAPEIVVKTWNDETLRLSHLRGKYVLIDFWASWCRPCRMENPNVVAAYQKFHSKGLEVFSVSLDNSVDNWKAAVQADGLVWPYHGSTLQGWQCPIAKSYRVSSIPFSVLIDPNGKIIAISLRGEALQQKLSELLP